MSDQAARLRQLAMAYRNQAAAPAGPLQNTRRTRVLAITSGKGGVGKSNISVNLSQALVARGKDVVLMDADLGLGNADILLGTVPPYHLGHLLRGERSLPDLIHRCPSQIKLIAGGGGLAELANMSDAQVHSFVDALRSLDGQADYLILDTGAGLGTVVQQFTMAADQVLVVTTPEPTALADAYTLIKTLAKRSRSMQFGLVVNQTEGPAEGADVANRLATTARSFLGVTVEHVGSLPRDPQVWQAVRRQVPFFVGSPSAPASRAIDRMADRLMGAELAEPPTHQPGFFDKLKGLFGRQRSVGF